MPFFSYLCILVTTYTVYSNNLNMKRFAFLLLLVVLGSTASVWAQYRQDRNLNKFMMKLEAGAMPYISNTGIEGEYGFIVNDRQMVGSVFMAMGINLVHDFFVGLGAGYNYFTAPSAVASAQHSATAYLDMDYRPFQTKYAPLISTKLGANYLLATPYGNSLKPYVEFCTGINVYTKFRFVNHERDNYSSWYFQIGVAHTQQTFFVPARIGLRF